MFIHYVDLEYEVILSNDLIGPIGPRTSFISLSPKYEAIYHCSFTMST